MARKRPNRNYVRLKNNFIEVIRVYLTKTDNINNRKSPKVILSGLYDAWANWDYKVDVKTRDIPFGLDWYRLDKSYKEGERICDLWDESPGICGDFLEDLDYPAIADGIRQMRYRPVMNSQKLLFEPYDNKPKEFCRQINNPSPPHNYLLNIWTPRGKESYLISRKKDGIPHQITVDNWQIFYKDELIGKDRFIKLVKRFGRKHFAEKHNDICSQLAES